MMEEWKNGMLGRVMLRLLDYSGFLQHFIGSSFRYEPTCFFAAPLA